MERGRGSPMEWMSSHSAALSSHLREAFVTALPLSAGEAEPRGPLQNPTVVPATLREWGRGGAVSEPKD